MDFLQNKNFKTLMYIIGIAWTARKIISILAALYRNVLRRRYDLIRRYGANSYAFVTGASDGIGKEFCSQLARRGFNLVLLARNKKKLEDTVTDLKKINPTIDTRIVIADLSQSQTDGFFEDIALQVKDLDISLLINNAGVDCFDELIDLDPKEIKKMIFINCLPAVLLTRALLPKMKERRQRSGIINVSSAAATGPLAYYSAYTGTKAFVDLFTRSIADEYRQFDILSLKPFDVSTKMIYYREPDLLTITMEECVRGALNDLGYQDHTYGHWKHKLQGTLFEGVPEWFLKKVYLKFLVPEFFKEREEGRKKEQEELKKKL